MEKIAVVYSSKYGHTKKYADWLKEDIGADVISIDSFNVTKLLSYKLTIFACGVYGDKLSVMDFVKKNLTAIPAQKIMVMAVSWYTNDSEEAKQKLIEENFPEQIKKVVPLYVVNSGIDQKKVPAMDKAKLLTARLMIEKKDGRSSDDINALAIIKGYSDQTSKDNLASIKKGIEEFFNPSKKEQTAPAASAPAPSAPAAAAAKAQAKPPVSNDLSASVDEAFKNLGAPKPKPAPEPKPAPVPAPEPVSEQPAAAADIKKPAPAVSEAPAAEIPQPEPQNDEPVVRFNSNGQVVVSSVLDAINSLNHTQEAPAYTPQPKVQQAEPAPAPQPQVHKANPSPVAAPKPRVQDTETEPTSASQPRVQKANPPSVSAPKPAVQDITPAPEPKPVVQDIAPVPAPAPKPVVQEAAPAAHEPEVQDEDNSAQRKNSYMELFASRRRKAAEGTAVSDSPAPAAPAPAPISNPVVQEAAPEPAPAPAAHEPEVVRSVATENDFGHFDFDITQTVTNAAEFTFAPQTQAAPAPPPSSDTDADMDMDGYDFIGEESASVSKRALNAVQDMAKAKAAAEKEAARKAAEYAAAQAEEDAYQPVHHDPNVASNAIEQMKHDIETFAEESEQGFVYSEESDSYSDSSYSYQEEEDDGLAAFDFADTADYYAQEPEVIVEPEQEEHVSREKADFDLRKLQEEINASIETNRATRERMQAKYGKKAKEEVHNPFAVQFDDEDEKKGKKGKKQAAEPKRLADPIDPDIFFNKPGKDYFTASDGMPEIKFRNR